jgi:hypothetical protein
MMLRDYDLAMVTKLGGVLTSGEYLAEVAGIDDTVPVLVAIPEEWTGKAQLPAINVTRMALIPDPSRFLPGFTGMELSTNPATPDTWNIQSTPSQPINLMYGVTLAAKKQLEMNALVEHCLLKLPLQGYGSVLSVFGSFIPFRSGGFKDKTDYKKSQDRVFVYQFTYVVEAWITPSLECEKVPQILSSDVTAEVIEVHLDFPEPEE